MVTPSGGNHADPSQPLFLDAVSARIRRTVESLNTLIGWQEWVFRSWYIAGAVLDGFPLAQGTAYPLLKRRTAHILTGFFGIYIVGAAIAVLATPISYLVVTDRLTGAVVEWQWVRLSSPLVNTYAFFFLVGGAIRLAWCYWRRADRPASGAGRIEVLDVTEFVGLVFIWLGYRLMIKDPTESVHTNQQEVADGRTVQ